MSRFAGSAAPTEGGFTGVTPVESPTINATDTSRVMRIDPPTVEVRYRPPAYDARFDRLSLESTGESSDRLRILNEAEDAWRANEPGRHKALLQLAEADWVERFDPYHAQNLRNQHRLWELGDIIPIARDTGLRYTLRDLEQEREVLTKQDNMFKYIIQAQRQRITEGRDLSPETLYRHAGLIARENQDDEAFEFLGMSADLAMQNRAHTEFASKARQARDRGDLQMAADYEDRAAHALARAEGDEPMSGFTPNMIPQMNALEKFLVPIEVGVMAGANQGRGVASVPGALFGGAGGLAVSLGSALFMPDEMYNSFIEGMSMGQLETALGLRRLVGAVNEDVWQAFVNAKMLVEHDRPWSFGIGRAIGGFGDPLFLGGMKLARIGIHALPSVKAAERWGKYLYGWAAGRGANWMGAARAGKAPAWLIRAKGFASTIDDSAIRRGFLQEVVRQRAVRQGIMREFWIESGAGAAADFPTGFVLGAAYAPEGQKLEWGLIGSGFQAAAGFGFGAGIAGVRILRGKAGQPVIDAMRRQFIGGRNKRLVRAAFGEAAFRWAQRNMSPDEFRGLLFNFPGGLRAWKQAQGEAALQVMSGRMGADGFDNLMANTPNDVMRRMVRDRRLTYDADLTTAIIKGIRGRIGRHVDYLAGGPDKVWMIGTKSAPYEQAMPDRLMYATAYPDYQGGVDIPHGGASGGSVFSDLRYAADVDSLRGRLAQRGMDVPAVSEGQRWYNPPEPDSPGGRPISEPGARLAGEPGGMTASAFRRRLLDIAADERNKLTPEEAEANFAIYYATAQVDAIKHGGSPDDWFQRAIADVQFRPDDPLGVRAGGSVRFRQSDGRAVIRLFKGASPKTILHEGFHIFRRHLDPDDMATLERAYGVEGGNWTVAQEEALALAGEKYVMTGQVPNAQLRPVFARFKEWMKAIYAVLGKSNKVKVPAPVKRVFDDMFNVEKVLKARKKLVKRHLKAAKKARTKAPLNVHANAVRDLARQLNWEQRQVRAALRVAVNQLGAELDPSMTAQDLVDMVVEAHQHMRAAHAPGASAPDMPGVKVATPAEQMEYEAAVDAAMRSKDGGERLAKSFALGELEKSGFTQLSRTAFRPESPPDTFLSDGTPVFYSEEGANQWARHYNKRRKKGQPEWNVVRMLESDTFMAVPGNRNRKAIDRVAKREAAHLRRLRNHLLNPPIADYETAGSLTASAVIDSVRRTPKPGEPPPSYPSNWKNRPDNAPDAFLADGSMVFFQEDKARQWARWFNKRRQKGDPSWEPVRMVDSDTFLVVRSDMYSNPSTKLARRDSKRLRKLKAQADAPKQPKPTQRPPEEPPEGTAGEPARPKGPKPTEGGGGSTAAVIKNLDAIEARLKGQPHYDDIDYLVIPIELDDGSDGFLAARVTDEGAIGVPAEGAATHKTAKAALGDLKAQLKRVRTAAAGEPTPVARVPEDEALIARGLAGEDIEHRTASEYVVEDGRIGDPDGDVERSFSADTIRRDGQIRQPFEHDGHQWVSVAEDEFTVHAYRVVPGESVTGAPVLDPRKTLNSSFERSKRNKMPARMYHGMVVTYEGEPHVLVGPPVAFRTTKGAEAKAAMVADVAAAQGVEPGMKVVTRQVMDDIDSKLSAGEYITTFSRKKKKGAKLGKDEAAAMAAVEGQPIEVKSDPQWVYDSPSLKGLSRHQRRAMLGLLHRDELRVVETADGRRFVAKPDQVPSAEQLKPVEPEPPHARAEEPQVEGPQAEGPARPSAEGGEAPAEAATGAGKPTARAKPAAKPVLIRLRETDRANANILKTEGLDPTKKADAEKIVALYYWQQADQPRNTQGEIVAKGFGHDPKAGGNRVDYQIDWDTYNAAYETARADREVPTAMDDMRVWFGEDKKVAQKAVTEAEKIAKMKRPAGPMPKMGRPKPPKIAALPAKRGKTQADAIKSMEAARATKDRGYGISGIHIDGKNAVATDGIVLYVKTFDKAPAKPGTYPAEVINKAGVIGGSPDPEVKFPLWKDITKPIEASAPIGDVDVQQLWSAARRAEMFGRISEEQGLACVVVKNKDGTFGMAGREASTGSFEVNVKPGYQAITILNPKKLRQALEFHWRNGNDTVQMIIQEVKNKFNRPIGLRGKDTLTVLMPKVDMGGKASIPEQAAAGAKKVMDDLGFRESGPRELHEELPRNRMRAYLAARGYVLKQDAVIDYRLNVEPEPRHQNAIELDVGAALPRAKAEALHHAIVQRAGDLGLDTAHWEPIRTHSGVHILNDPAATRIDNVRFNKAVKAAVRDVFGRDAVLDPSLLAVDQPIKLRRFRWTGERIANNWQEYPNGEIYRRRIAELGFGNEFQSVRRQLEQRVGSVQRQFADTRQWDAEPPDARPTSPDGIRTVAQSVRDGEPFAIVQQTGRESNGVVFGDEDGGLTHAYLVGHQPDNPMANDVVAIIDPQRMKGYDLDADPVGIVARSSKNNQGVPDANQVVDELLEDGGYDFAYSSLSEDAAHRIALLRPVDEAKPKDLGLLGRWTRKASNRGWLAGELVDRLHGTDAHGIMKLHLDNMTAWSEAQIGRLEADVQPALKHLRWWTGDATWLMKPNWLKVEGKRIKAIGHANIKNLVEGAAAAPNARIQEWLDQGYKVMADRTADEAERVGLVMSVPGRKKPIPFKRPTDEQGNRVYRFFRSFTPDARLAFQTRSGPVWEAMVEAVYHANQASLKNIERTEKVLAKLGETTSEALGRRLEPDVVGKAYALEHARVIKNFPEYAVTRDGKTLQFINTDPHNAIMKSGDRQFRRIAWVEKFGPHFKDGQVEGDIIGHVRRMHVNQGGNRQDFDDVVGSYFGFPRGWGSSSKLQRSYDTALGRALEAGSIAARSSMVSMASVLNFFQTAITVPGVTGVRNYVKAIGKMTASMPHYMLKKVTGQKIGRPILDRAELAAMGAYPLRTIDWVMHRGRMGRDISRAYANSMYIASGMNATTKMNDMISAQAGLELFNSWRKHGFTKASIDRARMLRLSEAEIKGMLAGQFPEMVRNKIVQNTVKVTQFLSESPHRKSPMQTDPFFNNILAFNSYFIGMTKLARSLGKQMGGAMRSGDAGRIMNATASMTTAVVGLVPTALVQLGAQRASRGYVDSDAARRLLEGDLSALPQIVMRPGERFFPDRDHVLDNYFADSILQAGLFGYAQRFLIDPLRYGGGTASEYATSLLPTVAFTFNVADTVFGLGKYGEFPVSRRVGELVSRYTPLVGSVRRWTRKAVVPDEEAFGRTKAFVRQFREDVLNRPSRDTRDIPLRADARMIYESVRRADFDAATDAAVAYFDAQLLRNKSPRQAISDLKLALSRYRPLWGVPRDQMRAFFKWMPERDRANAIQVEGTYKAAAETVLKKAAERIMARPKKAG